MARRHPCEAGQPLILTPLIPTPRLKLLSTAVELGVDPDDVTFESDQERRLWEELEEEFQALVSKIGPVWIAD